MFNFLDVVSAHVEGVEVGEAVEEPEGGDLPDAVVGEDEVGGGGGDPAGDVRQPAVGAVHLGALTPAAGELKLLVAAASWLPALGGAQRVLLAAVGGRPGLACNTRRYCRYYFVIIVNIYSKPRCVSSSGHRTNYPVTQFTISR